MFQKFAIEFSLSLQPFYEAKTRLIISEIGAIPNDNIELLQSKFQQFFDVAKLISDKEFLLKIRYMEINDRNVMQQLLEFLAENINFKVRAKCNI